jgi:hypothetical protein
MNHEHPVSQEELMAYGDGQLQRDQARQIAAHVESCPECEKALADAKLVSLEMTTWQVEKAPEGLTRSVQAALESRPRRVEWRSAFGWLTKRQAIAYGFGGAMFLMVAVAGMSLLFRYSEIRSYNSAKSAGLAAPEEAYRAVPFLPTAPPPGGPPAPPEVSGREQFGQGTVGSLQIDKSSSDSPSGPMIIRTVHLTLVTNSFEAARTRIESIVQESMGYVDQLSIRSEPKSPKGLTAVLRIPNGKLASSLIELRKLGQPKEESQNSADVTGQYVDLVARLSNARNTEQRLLTLLRDRTGNLKDVVAAEGEIARVRESIERMEAERKNFDNKVQYATIQVELSEEYHAQLQQTLPNTRTRIYNAAVEGYESASDTILGIALTILAVGPAALVWLAFLGCMGFLVWRLYVLLRSRQRSHAIHSV